MGWQGDSPPRTFPYPPAVLEASPAFFRVSGGNAPPWSVAGRAEVDEIRLRLFCPNDVGEDGFFDDFKLVESSETAVVSTLCFLFFGSLVWSSPSGTASLFPEWDVDFSCWSR